MVVKTVMVFFVSLIICVLTLPAYIRYARKVQFGQQIREDGPQSHLVKSGTPTMGGVVFLAATFIALIIINPGMNILLVVCILATFGNGFIGFFDDFGKVVKKASLGLKARSKILGQISITLILMVIIYELGHPTTIEIPFTRLSLELGYIYPVILFLIILGTTNAVNLTDGLDGLAAGSFILSMSAFTAIAYFNEMTEVVIFGAALLGGCFGFLLFNLHPAKVFMGDVGSLALGGALAVVAVLTKTELFLLIIGFVYVIEALSVIIQVVSFRLTKKRIFLMAPIHHHFELKGWSEWKIVIVFWMASFLCAIIGLAGVRSMFG